MFACRKRRTTSSSGRIYHTEHTTYNFNGYQICTKNQFHGFYKPRAACRRKIFARMHTLTWKVARRKEEPSPSPDADVSSSNSGTDDSSRPMEGAKARSVVHGSIFSWLQTCGSAFGILSLVECTYVCLLSSFPPRKKRVFLALQHFFRVNYFSFSHTLGAAFPWIQFYLFILLVFPVDSADKGCVVANLGICLCVHACTRPRWNVFRGRNDGNGVYMHIFCTDAYKHTSRIQTYMPRMHTLLCTHNKYIWCILSLWDVWRQIHIYICHTQARQGTKDTCICKQFKWQYGSGRMWQRE